MALRAGLLYPLFDDGAPVDTVRRREAIHARTIGTKYHLCLSKVRSLSIIIILMIIIINFIYNAPVPVLQKRALSTVQLRISGSIHS